MFKVVDVLGDKRIKLSRNKMKQRHKGDIIRKNIENDINHRWHNTKLNNNNRSGTPQA